MSIPSNPVLQDIILQGMKEGGQYTVTSSSQAYTEFKAYQWETIKTEIWNASRVDPLLETQSCLVAFAGMSNMAVSLPSDFDSEISVVLYDADEGFRGIAQAGGSSNTLTLAADFESTNEDMLGRYLFTVGGSGGAQHRQIIAYVNSTKVAYLDEVWTTATGATTEYVVGVTKHELPRRDYQRPGTSRRPAFYSRVGSKLYVYPAGDQVYPLILTYYANLTRLDDAGTVFTKHLRERRHLWVQGVKVKTMERYDDERRVQEKAIWDKMLAQYGAQNPTYTQLEGFR